VGYIYFSTKMGHDRILEEPIITLSNANTQNNLNSTIVKNIEIAIPSLSDQAAIANFLDKQTAKIDALIEKDKKLIALLKEKRTALINHAVTKGLDPNVKLKDSGIEWIGEIPEAWEVAPFKKYLESFVDYRGATPEKTNEGIFLVTGKNIKEGKIDYELSKEYVFEAQYEEVMHRGKPKIGDLLFTTEAPLGEVANVDYEKIALAQRIIKIRGKKRKLDNYYLKYYIMTQLFQSHLQSLATGSTALGLKASNWCFLRLIVPPLSEQLQIVQYLDKATAKIDKTIQKIEEKVKLLEEYKKSLIHHVVTGKVDVSKSEV
jgi:type I restriction enzyme S subunit